MDYHDFACISFMFNLKKYISGAPRPFVVLGTQINNPITDSGFSFPSGHTASVFALILPFIVLFPANSIKSKIVQWVMILFAALLAFSRFFIGVHYLSDIFAGASV